MTTTYNQIKNIISNWRNILNIMIIVIIFTIFFTILRPLKFKSSARLLVVQDYGQSFDTYSTSKSTQYLSDILSEVIYSTSFFNEVIQSDFNIETNYFSAKQLKRKKQWDKMISAKPLTGTGIIEIAIYHQSKNQAEQIMKGITYVLTTKHSLYHGGGDKVSVKIIDEPITSNLPVKPNILVNLILAAIFGILLGIGFIYLYPDYDFRFSKSFMQNKKKSNTNVILDYLDNSDNIKQNNHSSFDENGKVIFRG